MKRVGLVRHRLVVPLRRSRPGCRLRHEVRPDDTRSELESPGMSLSLKDYIDFVLLWVQKRTGVHLGELLIYPAMVRHCLCCQASVTYAHRTHGLCLKCCEEQVCLLCSDAFAPSRESVGAFCPSCWTRLETN